MQTGYLSAQPGWLTNLFSRRPIGLFDPSDLESNQAPGASPPVGVLPPDSGYAATRYGSDSHILRLLDETANNRPPMGLYDPRESDLFRAPAASDYRSLFPPTVNTQPMPATIRDGPDALIQRILENAATRRPMGLYEAGGAPSQPTPYRGRGQSAARDQTWAPDRYQNYPEFQAAIRDNTDKWGLAALVNMAAPLIFETGIIDRAAGADPKAVADWTFRAINWTRLFNSMREPELPPPVFPPPSPTRVIPVPKTETGLPAPIPLPLRNPPVTR